MEIHNFFGDPEAFKKRIAALDKQTFEILLAKKEEQWSILQRTKSCAYAVFLEDADDAYGRDALCMKFLYEEKEKRGL